MRSISRSAAALAVAVAALELAACALAKLSSTQRFDAAALAGWRLWGIGSVELRPEEDALELREGTDSQGVNLVSPFALPRHVEVRMRVKPLDADGVVVVMVSAAPSAGELRSPPGYRGELSLWSQADVASYAFAFHTAFHQPNAFVARNPGWTLLAEVPDTAGDERWYDVVVRRDPVRLSLAIDGTPVLDAPIPDPPGLGGGHLVVRLRGPGDGTFGALVGPVEVTAIE